MSDLAARRKGWCPGARRPMQTGDGLLVRVRISCGAVPVALARRLALLSALHGNGEIDLSQRANLQLRGVTEASLTPLLDTLAGLGVLDATAEQEAVRNVLVSPLAGLDPGCADAAGIGRQLERRLVADAALQGLPGKFAFTVDGGGVIPLGWTPSDISLCSEGVGRRWVVRLAGDDTLGAAVDSAAAVGSLVRTAAAFLAERGRVGADKLRRMRDLVAERGIRRVLALCLPQAAVVDLPLQPPAPRAIGQQRLRGDRVLAMVGLPFGRIKSEQLASLATAAEQEGIPALRLTPWRALFLPCASAESASRILATAEEAGLIVEAGDPRRAFDACPGFPACTSAETPAREDAQRLAAALGARAIAMGSIHVSGCGKGCARSAAADITLVGRAGRYDLVRRGTASGPVAVSGIERADLARAVTAATESRA